MADGLTAQQAAQQAIQQGLGQTLQVYFDEGGPQVGGNSIQVGNFTVSPVGEIPIDPRTGLMNEAAGPRLKGYTVTGPGMYTGSDNVPHQSQDTYSFDASGNSAGVQRNVDLGQANHLVLSYDAGGKLTNQSTYNDSGGGFSGFLQMAAGLALAPVLGPVIAAELGVSQAVGTALARVGIGVAQGQDLTQAVRDAAMSTLIQTGSADVANQIVQAGSNPVVANSLVSGVGSAAQAVAKGGSSEDIARSFAGGLAGGAVGEATGARPVGAGLQQAIAAGNVAAGVGGFVGTAAGQAAQQAGAAPTTALTPVQQRSAEIAGLTAPTGFGTTPVLSPEAEKFVSVVEADPGTQQAFLGVMLGAGQTLANAIQRLAATPAGQTVLQEAAQASDAVRNALINTGFMTAAGVAAFMGGKSWQEAQQSLDPTRQAWLSQFGTTEDRTRPTPSGAQIPTGLPPTTVPGYAPAPEATTVPGTTAPDQRVIVTSSGKPIVLPNINLPGLEAALDSLSIPGVTMPDLLNIAGLQFAPTPAPAPAPAGGEAPAGEGAVPAGEAITDTTDVSKKDPQVVVDELLKRIGVKPVTPGAAAATTPQGGPSAADLLAGAGIAAAPTGAAETYVVISADPQSGRALVINAKGKIGTVAAPPDVDKGSVIQSNEPLGDPSLFPQPAPTPAPTPTITPAVAPAVAPGTAPATAPAPGVEPAPAPDVLPKTAPAVGPAPTPTIGAGPLPTAGPTPAPSPIPDIGPTIPPYVPTDLGVRRTIGRPVTRGEREGLPPSPPPTDIGLPGTPPGLPGGAPGRVSEPAAPAPLPPEITTAPAPEATLPSPLAELFATSAPSPAPTPEIRARGITEAAAAAEPAPPPKPEYPTVRPYIFGVSTPTGPVTSPALTGIFRSPLEQALSAYTPPGEIEDPSTGKTRRDVWNEASLRLKDALGL